MKCGTKLERKCKNCGAEYPEEAVFCMKCGAKLVEEATTLTEVTVPKLEDMQKQLQSRIPQSLADRLFAGAKQMQGEYRLVTAIFADVVGSSRMARSMTLDEYVETIDVCFKMMVDTISIKYEGSINRFIGDCVLAFFGAPITHENDVERAILAALDIRNGLKELNLDVSIGINTGLTYVGEMGSDLVYSERSAWGPDVDFAKRLQEAANPGEIWVGVATYRLTRTAFDFEGPIDIEVKGMEKRQIAYPVLRVREHPEKLRGIEGLRARMIGREREFADLKEAADNLISGRGSIVTITGEAGIGKSRLALELKEYLEDKDVSWYEGRSISIGQTISYWPFLDMLRTYMNLSDEDSEAEIARKLKESITDLFSQRWEDILPFLGHLLSIKFGNEFDDKLIYFTPEQIKHQTLMRLKDVFTEISRRQPLLLILEDMHWSDDLSLDLVSLLMDELASNPLMLLCIYRPERAHRAWQTRDVASRKCLERYTPITLNRLSAVQSRQLVESLLEIENLPQLTKDMILTKSEGNPFFIEEVIRFLIAKDLVYREGDRWKARSEISDINVPDTIQSVVLARVDRLQAEAKYVLQCASVIGRMFKYRLLEHLTQQERNLDRYLSEFEERELVYAERTVPELEYAFRHAFTQEATYQGILERRRNQFHLQVAQGIEQLYVERLGEYYEELAYHYSKSDDTQKAIEYLQRAGEKAAQLSANEGAIAHFTKGLELLKNLPDTLERAQQELMLQASLGPVLIAAKGHGAPEVEEAFIQARELCGQIGETPQIVPVLIGMSTFYFARSEPQTARTLAEQSLRLAKRVQDPCMRVMAHNMLGATSASSGEFVLALEHLEQSIALYDPQQHKSLVVLYGLDTGLSSLIWAALGLLWLGYPDQAREKNEEQLKLARKLSHPFTLVTSILWASLYYYERRELQEAQECAEEGIALSNEYGFPSYTSSGPVFLGLPLAAQGQVEEGIAQIEKGLAVYRAMGIRILVPRTLTHLCKAYGKVGEIEKGLTILTEVMEETHSSGERVYEAETHRVKGELLLMQGEADAEVEACFQKARQVAQQQQAKLFELRAVTNLSRLWQKQGKQEEARQMLAEIYNWFTEGFDTLDLKEAKALLEELSSN